MTYDFSLNHRRLVVFFNENLLVIQAVNAISVMQQEKQRKNTKMKLFALAIETVLKYRQTIKHDKFAHHHM